MIVDGTGLLTLDARRNEYQALKGRVHQELLSVLDLSRLPQIRREDADREIRTIIGAILSRDLHQTPLTLTERDRLTDDVLNELFGLGPLEGLLRDSEVSDILVNGWNSVYVERAGKLVHTSVTFRDNAHLQQIIERIVSSVGRRIDELSPMVDARLADGSRVNAIIPPLALDGPALSIRRFPTDRLDSHDLIRREALTQPMLAFLEAAIRARLNVLISGGTGAGKTTLLNVLSGFIDERERIITIEDAAELSLRQRHVVRLETRPPNVEGNGAVRQRQLVINALRMRPDRIILGEVRGEEAIDMLQAMNTGHDGSLTTIHANTPRDALHRLDTMVAMANLSLPDKAVRQQVTSAIHVVVQVSRLPDGSRKVTQIAEITGMEGDVISIQDLFVFERNGVRDNGSVSGRFRATGIRPDCAERIIAAGVRLPPDTFSHVQPTGTY